MYSCYYILPITLTICFLFGTLRWKHNEVNVTLYDTSMQNNVASITANNDSFGLCVMVYGTTTNQRYITEIIETLHIYSNKSEVYFFMDDFGDIEDYKLCNILSDPSRCIWLKPKINNKTLYGDSHTWQTEFLGAFKTRSVFAKIKQMKLYEKCNFMIKSESDAYVDIERYSEWLNDRFDYNKDIYIGSAMTCFPFSHWKKKFLMANGIFTISKGIFVNHPDLIFNEKTIGDHYHEDCSFGYLMTELLHINVTDDASYLVYGRNQTQLWNQWKYLSDNNKRIYFSCHKCTGKFREYFIMETKKNETFNRKLGKIKGYTVYQPLSLNNGTVRAEYIYK
eukprot:14790_1